MGFSDIAASVKDPQQLLQKMGLKKGKIGKQVIDLILSSEPTYSWDVTKRALEAGYDAADLRRKKPVSLVLECIFVDKQYDVTSIATNLMSGQGLAPETWRDKYKAVKELIMVDEPLTVSDGLDTYKNMVVVEFTPHRDSSKGGALFCTIRLESVTIVKTSFADVNPSQVPTAPAEPAAPADAEKADDAKKVKNKTAKTKDAGIKATEATKQTPEQETTITHDKFGGLFGV
jgi:hypothetical protein